ncbi:conserved protein of unknown function [Candidatus Hydrogenisulfobacillus filiaventi]|uniref:Type II toxin-antitoxin system HicB family antitoxin n=1 Tax=Candidatus Hydrogenisulfobacillus filiaventi TaxID=2707344 RepID=A0A6F8ZJL1_9FIRM|nr:type II toxin-antitoxin system HicB family antitoxin [Bacillota bacterium]CAB1129976.1 conserved protein of unknown function [Candidatus Hydrogenisulfobacillus filiaventi]
MGDQGLLSAYIRAALARARFDILDSGEVYVEIPDCRGVWAAGPDTGTAYENLQGVLELWLLDRLRQGAPVPELDGCRLDGVWPPEPGSF